MRRRPHISTRTSTLCPYAPRFRSPHGGGGDHRQSSCDLAFGTSTGALGYRKFPNPRFDREAWLELNGSLASWDGYSRQMSDDPASADSHVRRLADGARSEEHTSELQ